MQFAPYLNFPGQCEAAFNFYKQSLGGEITDLMTFGGSPMAEHVPEDWHSKVLHAGFTVGDAVLYGSDATPERYEKPAGSWISLAIDDPAEAERAFAALSENGTVIMPIDKTFWAERFGMLVDQFDIPWMINCAPAE